MKKSMIIAMIAVFVLLVAGFFIFQRGNVTGDVINAPVKEFNIKAFKFGYTPDTIIVNRGDKVKITIDNTDVLHGIRIPNLNLRGEKIIEFTADKQGEFIWYCTVYCGEGHMKMQGKLVVK